MRSIAITFLVLLLLILTSGSAAFSQVKDGLIIRLPTRVLELYKEGNRVKTYSVGVGMPDFPTPTGTFEIIEMVITPGWENPYLSKGKARVNMGMKNPLGTRWIGFKDYSGGQYGIHGTNKPSSVGKYSSHGCVRMHIKDSEDLFKQVYFGMPVIVTNEGDPFNQVKEVSPVEKPLDEKMVNPLILDNVSDISF